MTTIVRLLAWWFTFSALWGVVRLFHPPEFISEVVAKPIVWLGITWLFFKLSIIPNQVITTLKQRFLNTKPYLTTFVLPLLFVVLYFGLINIRILTLPDLTAATILLAMLVNFSTGIVEEVVYRGVMYVWLLEDKKDSVSEALAFGVVQLLFVVGHLPTLLLNSDSLAAGLTHAFFIVLLGSIHTMIFRLTKSLYASSLTHGAWNTMVYLFLL